MAQKNVNFSSCSFQAIQFPENGIKFYIYISKGFEKHLSPKLQPIELACNDKRNKPTPAVLVDWTATELWNWTVWRNSFTPSIPILFPGKKEWFSWTYAFYPSFPCFLWFADIIWSKETHNITLKKWTNFFKLAYARGASLTLNKVASQFGLKNSNIEKETVSTKNDVLLTYKSQNAYLSGSNLPLWKQNSSLIEAATTPGFKNGFLHATTTKTIGKARPDWLKAKF